MNTPIPPGIQSTSNSQSADINVLKVNGNILYSTDFFSPFPNTNLDVIILPNNTFTKIEFNNNTLTSNNLSINNSVFTCLNKGFYTVTCSSTFFADQIPSTLIIRDNDTELPLAISDLNLSLSNNLTCVIYLQKNQNFIIDVGQTSGSSKNIFGPASFGLQFNVAIQKID